MLIICFPLREVVDKKHSLSLGLIELRVTTNRFEYSLMTILSLRKFPTRTWTAFRSLQGTSLVASDHTISELHSRFHLSNNDGLYVVTNWISVQTSGNNHSFPSLNEKLLIISFGKDVKSSSGKCQKSQSYKLVTEQVIEYLTLTMQKYEHILLKKILLVLYFVVFA